MKRGAKIAAVLLVGGIIALGIAIRARQPKSGYSAYLTGVSQKTDPKSHVKYYQAEFSFPWSCNEPFVSGAVEPASIPEPDYTGIDELDYALELAHDEAEDLATSINSYPFSYP